VYTKITNAFEKGYIEWVVPAKCGENKTRRTRDIPLTQVVNSEKSRRDYSKEEKRCYECLRKLKENVKSRPYIDPCLNTADGNRLLQLRTSQRQSRKRQRDER
jgi:hypothetical protein